MNLRRVLRSLLLGGLGAAVSVVLSAGSAAAQSASLEERVRGADKVVVATARSITASWRENEFGDRLIVSRVLLDVQETLRGGGAGQMWLDVEGGTLDGLTLQVSGQRVPEVGDRGVFMLAPASGVVHKLHRKGYGLLYLNDDDVVSGTNTSLTEIRARVRAQGR